MSLVPPKLTGLWLTTTPSRYCHWQMPQVTRHRPWLCGLFLSPSRPSLLCWTLANPLRLSVIWVKKKTFQRLLDQGTQDVGRRQGSVEYAPRTPATWGWEHVLQNFIITIGASCGASHLHTSAWVCTSEGHFVDHSLGEVCENHFVRERPSLTMLLPLCCSMFSNSDII